MTLQELAAREAIRHTLAVASQAGDHLVVEDYVACFTPDGLLEFGDSLRNEGHEQIRAWMQHAKAREAKRGLMRHNVTSTVIALSGPAEAPTAAEARSYFHVYTGIGPDHFGWYHDRLVPHDGRWRFRHRTVGVDWVSPQSRFAPKPA